MKNEELVILKKELEKLQSKRNEVLKIKKELDELRNNEIVKKYFELEELFKKKTAGRNTKFDEFDDTDLLGFALRDVEITPDSDVYVYLGTYKYDDDYDIIHSSGDREVSRYAEDADYVLYENIESINGKDEVQIPYCKANEFEKTHKVIFPKNVRSKKRYFYDLQNEYFELMVSESPEKANDKIKKLLKM